MDLCSRSWERVGPFKLGMSLFEVLNVLRTNPPVENALKRTAVLLSRACPMDRPIIVDVKSLGIKLRFEPHYQTLLAIDVYDVNVVALSFQGHVVGGNDRVGPDAGSLKNMYEILGVTHSGFRREELPRDAFCLQYPGLLVAFRVATTEVFTGIPLTTSDGKSPRLLRVVVHEFDFVRNVSKHLVRTSRTVEVSVSEDRGVELCVKNRSSATLVIGTSTCQDVLSFLGAPSKLHLKPKEPIGTKARRQNHRAEEADHEDYFFNYFDLGIDILLSGDTHVVRKVILRTNLPAHPFFGQYDKCPFILKFTERLPGVAKRPQAFPGKPQRGSKPNPQPTSLEELLTTNVTKPVVTDKTTMIASDEPWQSIARKLETVDEKPMMNEKADQPFGPCFLYGYRHTVFEIDKASSYLASLTLF